MRDRPGHGAAAFVAWLTAAALSLAVAPATPARAIEIAKAPSFRVKDLAGRTLDLDELRRHGPVLLDFWATWCKPCRAAMPDLENLNARYGPLGLTVIGVSIDGPRNQNKVRPFVKSLGITYPVTIDQDGRIQQLYQVGALPTAVLIDTAGIDVTSRVGYRPGEGASLTAKIAALLPAAAADSAAHPSTEP